MGQVAAQAGWPVVVGAPGQERVMWGRGASAAARRELGDQADPSYAAGGVGCVLGSWSAGRGESGTGSLSPEPLGPSLTKRNTAYHNMIVE